MAELVKIVNEQPIASNIVPPYGNFEGANFFTVSTGAGTVDTSNTFAFNGGRSLRLENIRYDLGELVVIPDDTRLLTTIGADGDYYLAFRVLKSSENLFNTDLDFTLRVYVNGVPTDYVATILNDDPFDTWFTFGQVINLTNGDELDFEFVSGFNLSSLDAITTIYIDSLQVARSNEPVAYTSGLSGLAWERLINLTTPIAVPANVDTFIDFSGALRKSLGGLRLINDNGTIQPFAENDVISVDVAFDFEIKTGTNQYISIWFDVNGQKYRAITIPIVKAEGEREYIGLSWTLPIESDLLTFGGSIYINSTTAIGLENLYINCVRYE